MKNNYNTVELVTNGLVTKPLPITWILGFLAYIHVETGRECAVINSERVIRKIKVDPFVKTQKH